MCVMSMQCWMLLKLDPERNMQRPQCISQYWFCRNISHCSVASGLQKYTQQHNNITLDSSNWCDYLHPSTLVGNKYIKVEHQIYKSIYKLLLQNVKTEHLQHHLRYCWVIADLVISTHNLKPDLFIAYNCSYWKWKG